MLGDNIVSSAIMRAAGSVTGFSSAWWRPPSLTSGERSKRSLGSRSERIDLCCHDEVVPVESADFVGPESHRHLTPFGENRRMMAFSLGEPTNAIREG